MNTRIENAITHRASLILKTLTKLNVIEHLPGTFALAGGCTSANNFNDIDIFSEGFAETYCGPGEVVSTTKNAKTIKLGDLTIQLCNYWKPTLAELVQSFDFDIIQSGALIHTGAVIEVYHTYAFMESRAVGVASFTDTEYPLSSLLRCRKYAQRGFMSRGVYAKNMIAILVATIERGFTDYEDFKDQLDSIDLGFLAEEVREVGSGPLINLYNVLTKGERI